MDIVSDLAAVNRRISEITGTPLAGPAPAAPLLSSAQAPFSDLVAAAMNGAPDPSAQAQTLASQTPVTAVPPAQFDRLADVQGRAWGVDPALLKAVAENESGFDPHATSPTGAQGLMQLEPGTAAELGVRDAYDPAQNVWGGARYLRGLLDRFGGNLRLAIAAYNAGPAAVEKYGDVPPYAETQAYVKNVLASYQRYSTQTLP